MTVRPFAERVPLLAITPGDGRDLDRWLRTLGDAGLPGVLVREPGWDADTLERALVLACEVVPFVSVHDRNPHARTLAARLGLPLHVAGGSPLPPAPFAASTHGESEVEGALAAGACYCLLSPVWAPLSKPDDTRAPLGPERFLAAARGRPVLALGGVTPERYRRLRAAGAGAAVLGALSVDTPSVDTPSDDAAELRAALSRYLQP